MITTAFLDRLTLFLAPLFMMAGQDIETARIAARETLTSYGATTNRELRLAALNIAFTISALDAMSKAADPDLPVNQAIRLRGNANALNRAADQTDKRFEALRKQPEPASEPDAAPALPANSSLADMLALAKTTVEEIKNETRPAMSRQQRRAAERQAAKAQRRKAEQDRLALRRAAQSIPHQMAA
jgi:hypothetical protein